MMPSRGLTKKAEKATVFRRRGAARGADAAALMHGAHCIADSHGGWRSIPSDVSDDPRRVFLMAIPSLAGVHPCFVQFRLSH